MRLSNIFIKINERDLLENLNHILNDKNILIEDVKINQGISIKNIKYKLFRNINIDFDISRVTKNKLYIEIKKIGFKYFYIPKSILDIFVRSIFGNLSKENSKNKYILIFDLNKHMKKINLKFLIKKIYTDNGSININLSNISFKNNIKKIGNKNGGGFFLRLTQTTLRLSGEDIMSFIRDFVKTDSVIISGIDISQAIYLKGIIINSFEVGDISVNIKDLRENLLYVQLKIINCILPGVNIEHIPIKIFVKDLLRAFNNLNLDLDVSSVRFIDDCIEVKINNLNLDMKKLSPNSNNVFLK